MKKLLIFIFLASQLFGQYTYHEALKQFTFYPDIIPNSRRANWVEAGTDNCKPSEYSNLRSIDNIDHVLFADNYASLVAAISAVNALPENETKLLLLSNKTYYLPVPVSLKNNTIITGSSGNPGTHIIYSGNHQSSVFNIVGTKTAPSSSNTITSGTDENSTTLTYSGTNISSDKVLFVRTHRPLESGTVCRIGEIESLSSNQVKWAYDRNIIDLKPSNIASPNYELITPKVNIGLENFTISVNSSSSTASAFNYINFTYAKDCWASGIKFNISPGNFVKIAYSTKLTVYGCAMYDAANHNPEYGYGINLSFSSYCLVENNIGQKQRHSIILNHSAHSNVIAYNYTLENDDASGWADYNQDICLHGNYPYANLFEGNIAWFIEADDHHGPNGPYNTFFRNHCQNTDNSAWPEMYLGIFSTDHANAVGNFAVASFDGNWTWRNITQTDAWYPSSDGLDVHSKHNYYNNEPQYHSYLIVDGYYGPGTRMGCVFICNDLSYYMTERPTYYSYFPSVGANYMNEWGNDPPIIYKHAQNQWNAAYGRFNSNNSAVPYKRGRWLYSDVELSPIVKNVGSGRVSSTYSGSFLLTNISTESLNLWISGTLYGNIIGSDPGNNLYVSLASGASTTIQYTGSFGFHPYGPFTEPIQIKLSNNGELLATHNIVGTTLLPDFCYAETSEKSATPEEQLFDAAFIGYFGFEKDTKRFDKKRTIKDRLKFAYKLLKQPESTKVEDICKMIIELYPESEMGISFYAMGLLNEAAHSKDIPKFVESEYISYLKYLANKKAKYKINGYALLQLSLYNLDSEMDGFEKLYNEYKYDSLRELALFYQFLHLYVYKKDYNAARDISRKLDDQFEKSRYGYQAHIIMNDKGYSREDLLKQLDKQKNNILGKRGEITTELLSEIPTEYKLFNNYPNPFNPTTIIKFSIPEVSNVNLSIYNTMGQLVKTLVDDEQMAPGFYSFEWNGTNKYNTKLASGVYFYRMECGNYSESNKMVLIK